MGSNINFKNFGNEPPGDGGGSGKGLPIGNGNFPLARQSSVYSLTFDEFQNTLGGMGKDFGSMNMDELLKNIWSAEETQSMATAAAVAAAAAVGSSGQDGGSQGGYLQRQGSLTLPRTLSQKTVDEVWKDIAKEFQGGSGKDGPGSNVPQSQRQHTLGEITLEEFLVRAGVVREEAQAQAQAQAQLPAKSNNVSGIFGDLARSSNNNSNSISNNNAGGFGINFQQPGRGVELLGNRIQESLQSTNLPLNVNGVRTPQQQATASQLSQQPQQPQQQQQQQQQHQQPQQQQQHQHQQPLFPKQVAVSYPMTLPTSAQLVSPGIRASNVGLADQGINSNLVPALQGGGMGMFGLGGGAIGVPTGSPANLSSDGLGKSNGDTSSVSPVPYVFNGVRGRKSHAVDKVVERRQRRMIKNRESAARSRARKQAYTMELEQEVAKLKAENQELRKKQTEIVEMQKNQCSPSGGRDGLLMESVLVLEMMNAQSGPRKRLRRTQTGPW